jgi:hypothetical protein
MILKIEWKKIKESVKLKNCIYSPFLDQPKILNFLLKIKFYQQKFKYHEFSLSHFIYPKITSVREFLQLKYQPQNILLHFLTIAISAPFGTRLTSQKKYNLVLLTKKHPFSG